MEATTAPHTLDDILVAFVAATGNTIDAEVAYDEARRAVTGTNRPFHAGVARLMAADAALAEARATEAALGAALDAAAC